MKVVVVGGGIAGLAAARQLESLLPEVDIDLVERSERLGGKLLTGHTDGFVLEGGADSFLSRKPRGVGLVEDLGLAGDLLERRPENAQTFVRIGSELHPLPEGLTGLVPTDLRALERTALLSAEGKKRLAEEVEVPPASAGSDESIASFVSRRFGRETYERLVEPLMTGIYGGDGEQLSLRAIFPNLLSLELEHGSILRGLAAQEPTPNQYPSFVSLRGGMQALVDRLESALERTNVMRRLIADRLDFHGGRYAVGLRGGGSIEADGVVLAVPAFAVAKLVSQLDAELARVHDEIPYVSSAIVTLGFRREDVPHPLDGYGYLVPRIEGSDVLACTWSSSKWENRAPAGRVLLRIYAGRFGDRDVTRIDKDKLVSLARDEVRVLGIEADPLLLRTHLWRYGMPQYVLGHPERLDRIDAALERHPGLAVAGAAYRGVGIPDCIHSGEEAARSLAASLAAARS